LQAAVVTLTARHRISPRGITELAHDLFGVWLSTGAVDGICQRASDALAGPHCQLQDWVLDQGAVHIDETGWRTSGDGAPVSDPSVEITALDRQPVRGHQGAGSLSDLAVGRLLTLQGTFRPAQIISLMGYRGQSNTLAIADHANRIEIRFLPNAAESRGLGGQPGVTLQPDDWTQLISRLDQILEPVSRSLRVGTRSENSPARRLADEAIARRSSIVGSRPPVARSHALRGKRSGWMDLVGRERPL
jgi:Transposase IS66 family